MSKAPASSENLFASVLPPKSEATATPTATAETPAAEPVIEKEDAEASASKVSALDMLKNRAKLMGIQHSPNIGIDALRAKIEAKMEGKEEPKETENQNEPAKTETAQVNADPKPQDKSTRKQTLRQRMLREEMRLIRVRITNLDPKKKDLPGEIFCFANRIIGSVKKYIPYGEATDNGYHVPYCIFKQLRDRQFLQIKTTKNSKGQDQVTSKYVREFALEVLPPLDQKELATLAAAQAAAGGLDSE